MAFTKSLAEMEQSVPDSDARKRLAAFYDDGAFTELDKFLAADGEVSSVVAGVGGVWTNTVYTFALDISVKGGSVNKAAALKIKRVYELAAKNGCPVVGFFDSKGADINEGMAVLAEYGDIMKASAKISGIVPQIAVVTGVCAGCAAMIASMADVVIATEKSELFLTSPFNNADGKIEGAGSALNAAKSGVCQILAKDDADAVEKAKTLISVLPANNLDVGYAEGFDENDAAISASMNGADVAAAVAQKGSIIEFGEKFGTAAYTALGTVSDSTVAFVATDKAAKLTSADCAKIARFVQFADVFSIPVVTIVNTEGFEGSSAAELAGSVRDCARLAQIYATATTVKVNIISGKAFGAAFAAFNSADMSFAWENAQIAPMSPEAGKVFMGEELVTNPFAAASQGMIDGVIDAADTRSVITDALSICCSKNENLARKHANYTF